MTPRRSGRALAMLVSTTLSAFPVAARPEIAKIEVDLDFATRYDSNVLRYSDADRDAFLRHDPASRFAIRSLDDAVFRTSASVAVSRSFTGRRSTRLRYTYTTYRHGQNPVEDFEAHAVSLYQPFARSAWMRIGYSKVPGTYVRHLWDEDFVAPYRFHPRYQPASYRSDRVSIQGGYRPWTGWSISARGDVRWQDYNASFEERDATTWKGSARIAWSGARGVSVSLEPSFADRRADATDPAHPAVADSLRDDVSYHAGGLAVQVRVREGRAFQGAPGLDVELSRVRRTYRTDRVADVYHHGRRDDVLELDVELERSVAAGASLYGLYQFERARSSGIALAGDRGDVADFDVWRLGGGIRFSWSGRLR